VLRARNMMYYITGPGVCQQFFSNIFVPFSKTRGGQRTFSAFVIPFRRHL